MTLTGLITASTRDELEKRVPADLIGAGAVAWIVDERRNAVSDGVRWVDIPGSAA